MFELANKISKMIKNIYLFLLKDHYYLPNNRQEKSILFTSNAL
jgi:hypothetical protein